MTVGPAHAAAVHLVAALDRGGVIGRDGELPWHLPDDLRFFRSLTEGGCVVMGRVTYDSIGHPLPNRNNIVVTRQQTWWPGATTAATLPGALRMATVAGHPRVFVIGGAQIYAEALPLADVLHLTRVDADHEGDTFFPDIPTDRFALVASDPHPADDAHAVPFTFERWEQRQGHTAHHS